MSPTAAHPVKPASLDDREMAVVEALGKLIDEKASETLLSLCIEEPHPDSFVARIRAVIALGFRAFMCRKAKALF